MFLENFHELAWARICLLFIYLLLFFKEERVHLLWLDCEPCKYPYRDHNYSHRNCWACESIPLNCIDFLDGGCDFVPGCDFANVDVVFAMLPAVVNDWQLENWPLTSCQMGLPTIDVIVVILKFYGFSHFNFIQFYWTLFNSIEFY